MLPSFFYRQMVRNYICYVLNLKCQMWPQIRQKKQPCFLCTQPRHSLTCLVKRRLLAPLLLTPCLVFVTDKTIKLWKISERDKRPEGYNLKEEDGRYKHPNTITSLRVSLNRLPRGLWLRLPRDTTAIFTSLFFSLFSASSGSLCF